MKEITQDELMKKIEVLGEISEQQRNEVVCTMIGHSRIIEACFGYIHCGRCKVQIGDCLMGSFGGRDAVVIGHKCETCVENMEKMTWKDTLFTPDPFAQEASND